MKSTKLSFSALFLCMVISQFCFAQETDEKTVIQNLITQSYIEPLYLGGDLNKIRENFHESFQMFVLYQGKFSVRSRDEWIEKIEKVRQRNLPKKNYTWNFDMIDFEGQTAVVKLSLNQDGKLKFIDYLTLYKFEEGWKVLTKQFSMY